MKIVEDPTAGDISVRLSSGGARSPLAFIEERIATTEIIAL
jgi:hypothetical protein